jgi:hypothetical protein
MKKEIWICDICGAKFEDEDEYDKHCEECLKKNYKVIRVMVSPEPTYGSNVRHEITWGKYSENSYNDGIHLWTINDNRNTDEERDYSRINAGAHDISMFQTREVFGIEISNGLEKEGLEKLKQYFLEQFRTSEKLVLSAFDELERQIKCEAKGENLYKTMKKWEEVKKF